MTDVHYRNAPIVEAVIDLRVRFGAEPTFDALKRAAATLKQRFPIQEDLAQVQLALKLGEVAKKKASSNLGQRRIGVRLHTGDNSRVLQFQQGGFAYSHLAPYTDWATFRAEALECWGIYKRLFKPTAVVRYAVRFINRISVPNGWSDCSLFTSLYPCVPQALGDPLDRYFMQLSLPQSQVARNAQLIINSTLAEGNQLGGAALMLDFDLFAPTELDTDSDEVWQHLDAFRVRKNEVFEACITDHTRGLIA
ncbi:TIGR04255 family protein [Rhodanobacter sp. DHG33]|uniref:TIGR04255 family protein n=1 Tax=Rhodanobacter sp. DHG33 TaxID=2775921 RepID=UPI001780D9C8|nr:TIGR04255 family protein [Rhodanobacter sp. DHG33]MBD8898360.1 TIGR04255 family protein [Rhodanobacter sp. DHG33]